MREGTKISVGGNKINPTITFKITWSGREFKMKSPAVVTRGNKMWVYSEFRGIRQLFNLVGVGKILFHYLSIRLLYQTDRASL